MNSQSGNMPMVPLAAARWQRVQCYVVVVTRPAGKCLYVHLIPENVRELCANYEFSERQHADGPAGSGALATGRFWSSTSSSWRINDNHAHLWCGTHGPPPRIFPLRRRAVSLGHPALDGLCSAAVRCQHVQSVPARWRARASSAARTSSASRSRAACARADRRSLFFGFIMSL